MATKKVVPSKRSNPPSKKRSAPKAKTPQQIRASKVSSAIKNPGKFAGSAKVKTVPMDAKWVAEVNKKSKAYNKSLVHKIVEPASQMFGPLYAIERAISAVSGKDLSKSPYDKKGKWKPKKVNRLGAAVDVAFATAPLSGKKVAKTIKKVKTVRKAKLGKDVYETVKKSNMGKKNVATTRNTKKAIYG